MRQILHEIDDKISPGELDLMIEEIDADGSGTVDFEGMLKVIKITIKRFKYSNTGWIFLSNLEFMEVMTGEILDIIFHNKMLIISLS